MRTLHSLLAAAALTLPASAGVNFVAEFEPGSRWFTESWAPAARAEMQAFLTDVGNLFDSEATVRVRITDDETDEPGGGAYASAGPVWYQWQAHPETSGLVRAPAAWMIIVRGITDTAQTADIVINWNMDLSIYSGNSAGLINNIRGLGRHEMHHALGCVSFLYYQPGFDPRGETVNAMIGDTLYRDANGNPLLGAFNPSTFRYTVNNFALSPSWATSPTQSGIYFEARDLQGRPVPMPVISSANFIDFSHIRGIAYANDHPTWNTYVSTDLNYLRALGYPLAVDSALRSQPATVTAFDFAGATAALTSLSTSNRHYRLATSTDLRHWNVSPVGKPGTGSPLGFSVPINKSTEPKRFFQVVEVPE